MRQMVGLVQRRGIFYFRRTIPDALRADMPAVLGTAGPGIFDESAGVSLKGSRAGREFWVSLGTRDEDVARDRARRLDGEADALVRLAKRRLALSVQPKLSELDDMVIQGLVATFRHRKLAADEARRRGADPLTREGFDALGQEIASREAELRDANARGDFTAVHFDLDAMMTVLDAGLNIAFGSPADRRLHLAFVETELEVMTVISDRHRGNTRPTPELQVSDALRTEGTPRPKREKIEASTPEQILDGWKRDQTPTEKTFYTFSSKVRRWTAFLAQRGATFQSASLSDASDWKIASLEIRSAKSVSNDIFAVKAIYGWAVANGKCPVNPFSGLKQPRAAVKGQRRSTKRDFTDEEAARILRAARDRTGYRRWVPWIACFTGARISEICQLERADITTSHGMHYFRMTTEQDSEGEGTETSDTKRIRKNLKNLSSKRIIPVHSRLIQEGFLDFVLRSKGRDLFPDATPDRFGNRGGNATKVISRWVREKLEITDPRISPSHSFRHRFSTSCKNFGVPPEIRDRLMGHSSGDASELYGEDYAISTLCPEIEKLPVPTGLG
ncbi:DUF6538 domain-containing protein [Methylobacterium sp. E-066]|uniref:DUF6538 domain-containing protein n=1 Tax=Methylobacterium sp. E-066 TaxID=2836584 RepID=UPI001FB98CFE|nr:DUF6538 domain-containing protein [Methylobacterium sp. E-066]MCJ2143868.1 tyrosine-type recombinase/integrase [Methylobacterium sp. E-066]